MLKTLKKQLHKKNKCNYFIVLYSHFLINILYFELFWVSFIINFYVFHLFQIYFQGKINLFHILSLWHRSLNSVCWVMYNTMVWSGYWYQTICLICLHGTKCNTMVCIVWALILGTVPIITLWFDPALVITLLLWSGTYYVLRSVTICNAIVCVWY